MEEEYGVNGDYGKEIILDLHDCDPSTFTRDSIEKYIIELCEAINMERRDLHWWDELDVPEEEKIMTLPHLSGTSAIQFIKTSNITIHTLDIMKRVYLNVFSCKDFDATVVKGFSENWFRGTAVNEQVIRRV